MTPSLHSTSSVLQTPGQHDRLDLKVGGDLSLSLTPAETGEGGDDDAAEEDQHPGYQQDVSEENTSQTSGEVRLR